MTTTATLPVTQSTLIAGFVAEALTLIDTSAKPEIVALINSGEIKAEALLTSFLTSLPVPSGIEGALLKPIEKDLETAAESYAAKAVAQYGGEVIFDVLIDPALHKWGALLGG
jgi:hypothetical protein